ncbi:hypothetical protein [Mangrovihabitans endophyticus]|uniref:Uncharacterized protein n=1 Tax=Mangrovihabitans endophyticus TaxID=1751298 RepID=A0A8J3FS71_9ACTN|nr:hypothetical protein [Mangrovihabitans endophyticus]GGL12706.1 hypothetical protein GCM10012284_54250 [Mangrovihabitans endophyticus]
MSPPPARRLIFSHYLLRLPGHGGARRRIGYHAAPAATPGMIRASRAVAAQIAADLQALRAETLAAAARREQFYDDALVEVDSHLPRIEKHGEHLVADWRLVTGDRNAVRATSPDPDGRYTLDLGLGWQRVGAGQCDTVRDDTTGASPLADASAAYASCFTDAPAALLHLAGRAGIAVAWLDRDAIEAGSRELTDEQWALIRDQLDQYHEHVSGTGTVNSTFLDRIFARAGLERRTSANPGE